MYVKMNKINKSNINKSGICDFFSPPFSLVMANLAAGSSAGESVLLTLDKRNSLKSKLLRASSGKISYMQETIFIEPVNRQEKPGLIRKWQRTENPWKGFQKRDERKKVPYFKTVSKKRKI